jgi:peptide chain release factor 1
MLSRLERVKVRYQQLGQKMSDPAIISDQASYMELSREHKRLGSILANGENYRQALAGLAEAKELMDKESDPEIVEMAEMQLAESKEESQRLEQVIRIQLVPRDPTDFRNCIVEIRAGTGGDEAALFAADLFRMYQRFAETSRWKLEIMDTNEGSMGGFKEIVFALSGEEAFGTMKYEGGVHRVQRVPSTESQGRVHTSAASVAVLPEAQEVDVQIEAKDIRIDVYRSSGPGGQSVNTTDSAVRITHLPTGMIVTCQDEKSQHKNKDKAMTVLRSRLYELKLAEEKAKQDKVRSAQVSTGDRSAKIRTYNFPQNRVTDHRINLTLYKLEQVMDGDLAELIESLKMADMSSRLEELDG